MLNFSNCTSRRENLLSCQKSRRLQVLSLQHLVRCRNSLHDLHQPNPCIYISNNATSNECILCVAGESEQKALFANVLQCEDHLKPLKLASRCTVITVPSVFIGLCEYVVSVVLFASPLLCPPRCNLTRIFLGFWTHPLSLLSIIPNGATCIPNTPDAKDFPDRQVPTHLFMLPVAILPSIHCTFYCETSQSLEPGEASCPPIVQRIC